MRLTPRSIREHLGLNKPIYTAAYGHFGRTAGELAGSFSWRPPTSRTSWPQPSDAG